LLPLPQPYLLSLCPQPDLSALPHHVFRCPSSSLKTTKSITVVCYLTSRSSRIIRRPLLDVSVIPHHLSSATRRLSPPSSSVVRYSTFRSSLIIRRLPLNVSLPPLRTTRFSLARATPRSPLPPPLVSLSPPLPLIPLVSPCLLHKRIQFRPQRLPIVPVHQGKRPSIVPVHQGKETVYTIRSRAPSSTTMLSQPRKPQPYAPKQQPYDDTAASVARSIGNSSKKRKDYCPDAMSANSNSTLTPNAASISVRIGDVRPRERFRKCSLRLDVLEEEYKRAQNAYFAALYRAEKGLGFLGTQRANRTSAQASAIKCRKCSASFSSNNKLHIHLRSRCCIVAPLNGDDHEPQQLYVPPQLCTQPQPDTLSQLDPPPKKRFLAKQHAPAQPYALSQQNSSPQEPPVPQPSTSTQPYLSDSPAQKHLQAKQQALPRYAPSQHNSTPQPHTQPQPCPTSQPSHQNPAPQPYSPQHRHEPQQCLQPEQQPEQLVPVQPLLSMQQPQQYLPMQQSPSTSLSLSSQQYLSPQPCQLLKQDQVPQPHSPAQLPFALSQQYLLPQLYTHLQPYPAPQPYTSQQLYTPPQPHSPLQHPFGPLQQHSSLQPDVSPLLYPLLQPHTAPQTSTSLPLPSQQHLSPQPSQPPQQDLTPRPYSPPRQPLVPSQQHSSPQLSEPPQQNLSPQPSSPQQPQQCVSIQQLPSAPAQQPQQYVPMQQSASTLPQQSQQCVPLQPLLSMQLPQLYVPMQQSPSAPEQSKQFTPLQLSPQPYTHPQPQTALQPNTTPQLYLQSQQYPPSHSYPVLQQPLPHLYAPT